MNFTSHVVWWAVGHFVEHVYSMGSAEASAVGWFVLFLFMVCSNEPLKGSLAMSINSLTHAAKGTSPV